ncbi:SURF1 family protein [Sphingosinithalassobacter portus]|uniref:SURF1 family protein n=1 Tax=Stakelama portus TaxID=2676234 RepID=UPI000D6E4739|nr:SURF1 family protein [Sphingosinithalassobacter portus]
MPRLPILPTLLVALAVAAMIALGIWQLDRRDWKLGLIERYSGNLEKPEIAFPRPPVGERYLFRRAHGFCLRTTGWQTRAGHSVDGTTGYRQIAECATGGAEGPVLLVDMGVTSDPKAQPQWRGGPVRGVIGAAPGSESVIGSALSGKSAPILLMLVSDTPAPGLQATQPPDPASLPNNHLAYAVQWFLFAAVAVIIYLLALRRRQRRAETPDEAAPKS